MTSRTDQIMKLLLANLWALTLIQLVCWPLAVSAEIVRFEITERSDFANGESFGQVGPYERIEGKVHFEVAPAKSQNKQIVDLQFAPRNKDGHVEFSSDLYILAPKDLSKGNQAVLYDVNNRGNKLALRFFNDAPGGNNPKSAGNGFLLRRGFTIVWSGWNGEVLPGNARLRLHAPVGKRQEQPITGLVRYEIVTSDDQKVRVPVNRSNHGAYPPTERGLHGATLTWRLRPEDRRVPIPRQQFKLHVSPPPSPDLLPQVELEVPAGLRKGYSYEVIYEARDPLVHGVCFASVRDLISGLKRGAGEDNPLSLDGKPAVKLAYGFGVSQSGRFLRELLYAGFNESEQGERVFDGLMPHVAGAGLGSFNHRFAQPTAYATQHQLHDWPTDRFPFSYQAQVNPLTGGSDSILGRAVAAGVAPKVIHTQSATEYWSRSGSLVHTDPTGKSDAAPPSNVRVFAFGGTQHGPASYPPSAGIGQTKANPADYRPLLRALLVGLDQWCRDNKPLPPSIYPTIAEGTLVDWRQPSTGFPFIPGVRYPEVIQQPSLLNLGKRWADERIVDIQPPRVERAYTVLVPKCGPDGNELGCLTPPEVTVPLATFSGWSLRSREAGAENDLVGLNGSYILLPVTKEEKESTGDPRRSLQERYGTVAQYMKQLEDACNQLVGQRYLLAEDVPRIVQRQKERAKPLFEKLPRSAAVD